MNYWQFKFNMKKGEWDEFSTITNGEQFSQSTTKNLLTGCMGDIVFYYQTDKKIGIGIHFIAEIISEPYQEEYNTKYAIKLRIVKKLDPIFNDISNNTYAKLQSKLNPMGQGASKYLFEDEDDGLILYQKLMKNSQIVLIKDIELDNTMLAHPKIIKQKYIDNGYLFKGTSKNRQKIT